MGFQTPKGWKQESEAAYIHPSGARIERRIYRGQEGWFLIPPSLDQEVLSFAPTPEGRDGAFAAFAAGKLKLAKKRSASQPDSDALKPKRGRKPKLRPEPESDDEETQPGGEEEKPEEEDDDT